MSQQTQMIEGIFQQWNLDNYILILLFASSHQFVAKHCCKNILLLRGYKSRSIEHVAKLTIFYRSTLLYNANGSRFLCEAEALPDLDESKI